MKDCLKVVAQTGATLMVGGFGVCGNPENLIAAIRETGGVAMAAI